MAYKILYLEDLPPFTIAREIEQQGFEVIPVQPNDNFEETLSQIQSIGADLLLMDFRLNAGKAKFNAPPFAQFFRSQVIDGGINLPIVVISSENNIRDYYRDYTSFDLFDFAVDKETFLQKTEKYCNLFNELIEGYQLLRESQLAQVKVDLKLLKIPEAIENQLDSRFLDLFSMEKYQTNACMMTGLLLTTLVKPAGILIGPDILSARLGVSRTSPDWSLLIDKLKDFKYTGLYSKTYDRWWSQGIDIWWKSNFPTLTTLRRLSANERCKYISEKFSLSNLQTLEKQSDFSNSNRFWTVCSGTFSPLDPIDGFEIARDLNNSPWLEPRFYSLNFLVNFANQDNIKELKEPERERLAEVRSNS
ncbi:hypothetical protein BFR77_12765 [Acinetobacter pittii]|uniref:response regulator n=1 Tax=Acinetobacter pittii TaxID=48296 RepID=UPI0008389512|nr:response regulator [Acinetobacter pittii]OCY39929.1 hypothetical protein BFR77_12765 [Acinetobacter pittii]